ncbi:glycoside hydrolase family 36 protein [Neurospora crassa]|nr:glycoside hydrolase family 36 protein [Neurospora crassa]
MSPFVVTYPPLEQITQLKDTSVTFHAVLEVPKTLAPGSWQLALWHSTGSYNGRKASWVETPFAPSGQSDFPSTLHDPADQLMRLHFTVNLTVQSTLNFTIKFRQGPDHDWRWVRNEQGLGDGYIVVDVGAPEGSDDEDLPDLIHGLNPSLKWSSHLSQCPGTRLWTIEVPVDGAKDDDNSTFSHVPLGIPWGGFLRWFALVRDWSPWLAPRQGRSTVELDKDALLCSFLSSKGKHLVLLGFAGINNAVDGMTLFRNDEFGRVTIHIRNDSAKAGSGTVLVAVGDNFESANAAVMYHARGLVSTADRAGESSTKLEKLSDNVEANWYENWYDGLGYCTWNALGQRLTAEKVITAVDALADNNINISNLIIDDNWQDIDYHGDQWQQGWNDFEAEPKAFPNGLTGLVSEIRSKHKNIEHVAVWHALLGYWAGIAPDGNLAKRYRTIEVVRGEDSSRKNIPLGGKMTVIAKEDIHKFYDDFYRFLSESGVAGVKTDAQFMIDTWVSPKVRRELIQPYLDNWLLASLRYFSGRAISCMSMSPQIIFHTQLPRGRPTMLCRNSDDFFPDVPSSHPWHVWANAHNSLLTQHLNILPDWDMFQTTGAYAGFHAAARCVSGGPIYITDVPGQYDLNLIKQMTGVTPRGRTVIFRPSVLGRSFDQYVNYDDLSLLKISAYNGRAVTGTPIMGIFNVSGRPLTELIPLARFSGVLPSMWYVVRSHQSGKVTVPVQTTSSASLLTASLDNGGYDILSVFPLSLYETESRGRVYVASLGLVGKMTGCAAMLNHSSDLLENGRLFISTRLKALGVLGIYISHLPELSIQDEFMVTIQGQPIPPHTVTVNRMDSHVLDIDIESAWKEMGLEAGWSNEVEVKVYLTLEK